MKDFEDSEESRARKRRNERMAEKASQTHESLPNRSSGARLFAAGGIVGAVLASTCCIAPLLLVMLGVGGAWIGELTRLEPYKPLFLTAATFLLAAGFWRVYFAPKPDCVEGSYCARPMSSKITKLALWSGAILTVLAATISVWAPLLY